jgi:hypothetical protein
MKNQGGAVIVAELALLLDLAVGGLTDEKLAEHLEAAKALMAGPDDQVLGALRQLGLDVVRLWNARLRREVERRDPRRGNDATRTVH